MRVDGFGDGEFAGVLFSALGGHDLGGTGGVLAEGMERCVDLPHGGAIALEKNFSLR